MRLRGDIDVNKMDVDKFMFAFYKEDIWYSGSDWPSGDDAQGKGTMAGAVFDVYNATGGDVTSPAGQTIADGALVCTIVTRADGMASTKYEDTNGWATLDNLKALGGALDVGYYTVRERTAPVGYKPNAAWIGEVTVEHNKVVRVTAKTP